MNLSEVGLAFLGICFWTLVIIYVVRERLRESREAKELAAQREAQERLLRHLQTPKSAGSRKLFKVTGLTSLGLALGCVAIGLSTGESLAGRIQTTLILLGVVFGVIVLPILWLCSGRPWLRNLRRPAPVTDAQLGKLRFSFGFEVCMWRGFIALAPGTEVPLAIVGNVDGPAPEALSIARELPSRLASSRADIEKRLFEHYEPYAEALASGELKHQGEPLPSIKSPEDIWPLISWVNVSILPIDGELAIELHVTIPWDEEHTLGLFFSQGTLCALCGSV